MKLDEIRTKVTAAVAADADSSNKSPSGATDVTPMEYLVVLIPALLLFAYIFAK